MITKVRAEDLHIQRAFLCDSDWKRLDICYWYLYNTKTPRTEMVLTSR